MPPDFQTARYIRQYCEEQWLTFARLSFLPKAVAAYVRNLVDPEHGWLPLGGQTVAGAIRRHAAGKHHKTDQQILERCIAALLTERYLVRCRVDGDAEATFTTADQREVPLSNWLELPEGHWVVVKNWVPAQHGLTPADTRAWHQARREHVQRTERQS